MFISVIIYIGVHKEPQVRMYQNTEFNQGPIHPISNYMSLNRYKQIKPYCYILRRHKIKRIVKIYEVQDQALYENLKLQNSEGLEESLAIYFVHVLARMSQPGQY